MSHLNPQILGRNLDAESRAEILNVAKLTLANAASAAGEAVRYDEYNTDVTDLQSRVTTIENSSSIIEHVHVDTTSADLATAIAAGSFDSGTNVWTFGTDELTTGDLLVLTAATEQDSDRSWIVNGTNGGTTADFTALGSDVDAAISAAIASVVGDAASEYDTLGKIEDKHIALDARVVTAEGEIDTLQTEQALRPELRTFTGTFTGPDVDGVYTSTLAHSFNSTALHIELQTDEGAGVWEYVDSGAGFIVKVDTSNITVTTESASLASHSIRAVATGIEA